MSSRLQRDCDDGSQCHDKDVRVWCAQERRRSVRGRYLFFSKCDYFGGSPGLNQHPDVLPVGELSSSSIRRHRYECHTSAAAPLTSWWMDDSESDTGPQDHTRSLPTGPFTRISLHATLTTVKAGHEPQCLRSCSSREKYSQLVARSAAALGGLSLSLSAITALASTRSSSPQTKCDRVAAFLTPQARLQVCCALMNVLASRRCHAHTSAFCGAAGRLNHASPALQVRARTQFKGQDHASVFCYVFFYFFVTFGSFFSSEICVGGFSNPDLDTTTHPRDGQKVG
jgi:hypothetical protein